MNFLTDWKSNTDYFKLLGLMASLSNLYSDSQIPFLHYRVAENLFCKYYNAENLSRTDTAYDAKKGTLGVGIKTFQLTNNTSLEKVAEFNAISNQLKQYSGEKLALEVAKARNERIELGMRLYAIKDCCYHIVGRIPEALIVFNSQYPFINLRKIHSVVDTGRSLQFQDDREFYSFNYSKSTLFKRFKVPTEQYNIPVSIIHDPYELLQRLIEQEDSKEKYDAIYNVHEAIHKKIATSKILQLGVNYVELPLFSERQQMVPERSGLNQWNAGGRARHPDEVYIPIPKKLHDSFPDFFPPRDTPFNLRLPNGNMLSAKVCQDGGKALMSNPNLALGKWILRDVLKLKEGELVTLELLDRLGFNSVSIFKDSELNYRIDVCTTLYQGY